MRAFLVAFLLILCIANSALSFSDKTTVKCVSQSKHEKYFLQAKHFTIDQKAWQSLLEILDPEQREVLETDPLKRARYLNYLAQVEIFSRRAKEEHLEKDPRIKRLLEFRCKELLARLWLEKEVNRRMEKVHFTEEDLKLYYDTHSEDFRTPEGKIKPFFQVKSVIKSLLEDEYRQNLTQQIIQEALREEEVRIYP